ncbi:MULTISPECIES: ferritin-like domain-containing protein [unclassified Sporosarcina]|uniref:ferritin-like domain-containing protein n=1 Tax=unclassified Sporosarcina TaxID=2647733 RepID=UPI001E615A98|nr:MULTISPECIES: ferritin-like domain-containing protein [unclassified Sporosarcina]
MYYLGNSIYQGYDPEALQKSLALMFEAVQGEKEDRLFYEYLISVAPTQEDKEIISSIRDDEIRHNLMFKKMYKDFTGQEVMDVTAEDFKKPASYIEGIQQALFGELKAVEKYREIRKGLPDCQNRDIVFDILTDELKHAAKYNFLYTENRTNSHVQNESNIEKTPDDWIRYTEFLVEEAQEDVKRGINLTHVFQEFILMGVLVGKGYSPKQAYETVESWERTGESQLLQESKKIP